MSQALEDALICSDDVAACQSLHDLLAEETLSRSPVLPTTAKAYLEAFCDHNRPVIRRRWTGLNLAKLIESRPKVVPHLRQNLNDLARLGAIILGSTEVEETKIVAGLIIRAGLTHGFKFTDFWSVEKAHVTAPMFPKDADTCWMKNFQDYLDTLTSQIPLGGTPPQLAILYPIALIASDGYTWTAPDSSLPILFIESHALTIITPEPRYHEIRFVHISKQWIQKVSCRPYDAYDSQDREANVQPWQVVLEFHPGSSYQVNCSQRFSSSFIIVVQHDDAQECITSINEILFPDEALSSGVLGLDSSHDRDRKTVKTAIERANPLSKGGVLEFNRSENKGTTPREKKRTQEVMSDAADTEQSTGRQTKPGTIPAARKSSRLSGATPDLGMNFECPDESPSVKRTKTKKRTPYRKRSPIGSVPISGSAISKEPISRVKTPIQDTAYGKAEKIGTQRSQVQPSPKSPGHKKEKSKATRLPKIVRSSQRRVPKSRREQTDVLSSERENHHDDESIKRGTKRTRAKTITYREDISSEGDDSGSEYEERKKAKRPRGRPSKLAANSESWTQLSAKQGSSSKKKRGPKVSTQPLKGSLLANLQKSAVGEKHNSVPSTVVTEPNTVQAPAVALQKLYKPSASRCLEEAGVNLSSEACILSKLNNVESDDDFNGSQKKSGTTATKQPSLDRAPSTPRSKRAKLDNTDAEGRTNMQESAFSKPPSTFAPMRILQEASSPCTSRVNGSMQAPPRPEPTTEETIKITSPRRQPRTESARKWSDQRQTPIHQLGKRSLSDMSGGLEILSSNSKPTPASPHAASTAISGHADRHDVTMEKALGEYKIEKSDPFRSDKPKVNEFTRRLRGNGSVSPVPEVGEGSSQHCPIELGDSPSSASSDAPPSTAINYKSELTKTHVNVAQRNELLEVRTPDRRNDSRDQMVGRSVKVSTKVIIQSRQHNADSEKDANHDYVSGMADLQDDTLVDLEEPQLPELKVTPMNLRSSPPPMNSSTSSHSSTSAELEPKTDSPALAPEDEEMEWEASLKPYQRDLKDQLLRVSNRVLRHVIDNESAVNEIAETYAEDGQHSLDLMLHDHKQKFDAMHEEFRQKKTKITKASEKVLSKLRKEREAILKGE